MSRRSNYQFSKEHREKISKSRYRLLAEGRIRKGFKLTEEHKDKIREANKKVFAEGRGHQKHTQQSRQKIFLANIKYPLLWDKKLMEQKYIKEGMTLIQIAKFVGCKNLKQGTCIVSQALKKQGIKTRGYVRGSAHWQWKGGISNPRNAKLMTREYVAWRKAIFLRDNYTCQSCGQIGGKLEAHHLLPYRDFPHLIHALHNGMTLCKKCHRKTIKKEYLFIQTYAKRGELLESLKVLLPTIISSQVPKEILGKVQRLITESDKDSNVNTSALPERDDIVCTNGKPLEVMFK